MWLVNFVQGKNCLLEKTCWVSVGGRNLPGGSSETTPTCIHPLATPRKPKHRMGCSTLLQQQVGQLEQRQQLKGNQGRQRHRTQLHADATGRS
jgi:hypothetical protein